MINAINKVKDGINISIRLTPKAKQEQISGTAKDEHGKTFIKISVTAVPEKGKANAALIKFLSKKWSIAKSSFNIVSGETDRNKVLHITGNSDELYELLKKEFKKS